MDSTVAPSVNIEPFYRLALLLCGNAKSAECVLATVLREFREHEGTLRSTAAQQVWLVSQIRQTAIARQPTEGEHEPAPGLLRTGEIPKPGEPLLGIEVYLVAQRFSCLSEPGRSALALFYLEILPLGEVLTLLELSWDRFCEALTTGREELRASIEEMRTPEESPVPEAPAEESPTEESPATS